MGRREHIQRLKRLQSIVKGNISYLLAHPSTSDSNTAKELKELRAKLARIQDQLIELNEGEK